ncbi:hypothetical protein GCM10027456_76760 [Kineosporia babensis]
MMGSGSGQGFIPGQEEDPPAGWPKPYRSIGRIATVMLFALLTALSLWLVWDDLGHGPHLATLNWVLAALLFGHIMGLTLHTMRWPKSPAGNPARGVNDQGEPGVMFVYSGWAYYWLCAVAGICAFAVWGYAIAAGLSGNGLIAVLGVAIGASLAWYLVAMARTGRGRVVLTQSGIYHRVLVLEHFVPWHAVTEIQARAHHTPWITVKALPTPDTRLRNYAGRFVPGADGLPFMIIRAYWLGGNAATAYAALHRYFYEPEARAELG